MVLKLLGDVGLCQFGPQPELMPEGVLDQGASVELRVLKSNSSLGWLVDATPASPRSNQAESELAELSSRVRRTDSQPGSLSKYLWICPRCSSWAERAGNGSGASERRHRSTAR